MTYIDSNKISVYPASHRIEYVSDSRLLLEKNLVRFINQITDMKSFVISEYYTPNSVFEFNLCGYYFKINRFEISSMSDGTGNYLYAEINLIRDELDCSDENDKFTGIHLFKSNDILPEVNPSDSNNYRFMLLKMNNGSWEVPLESQVKFKARSLGLESLSVDGGKI